MGIFETVGIVLVVLKLCSVIDWSWWTVLLPFYGPWIAILFLAWLVGDSK